MKFDDLKPFLEKDEDECLEFKESLNNDELGQTMAAMSTNKGGDIFIGITDEKIPIGIYYDNTVVDKITSIGRDCDPKIPVETSVIKFDAGEKCVIHVKIPKGAVPPYSHKGVQLRRIGRSNRTLTADEVVLIKLESFGKSFLDMPASNGRIGTVADIDENKVIRYLEDASIARKKTLKYSNLKHILTSMNLLSDDGIQPKYAAIAIFGKNPTQFLPQNKINLLVFSNDSASQRLVFKEIVEGTIVEMVQTTMILIQRFIKHVSVIKELKRIEIQEYPSLVLREAIVNAVVHREYLFKDSDITIKMFDNRIEITNPGGLPYRGLTPADIKEASGKSARRNEILADLLDGLGLMERAGTGIVKMKDLMLAHGLKEPEFYIDKDSFKVILHGMDDINLLLKAPGEVSDTLSDLTSREALILTHILEFDSLSSGECESKFGINKLAAIRSLRKLINKGLVEKRGTGKSTRYYTKLKMSK